MVKIETAENEVIDQEIKVEGVSNNFKRKSSDSDESSASANSRKKSKISEEKAKVLEEYAEQMNGMTPEQKNIVERLLWICDAQKDVHDLFVNKILEMTKENFISSELQMQHKRKCNNIGIKKISCKYCFKIIIKSEYDDHLKKCELDKAKGLHEGPAPKRPKILA